MAIKARGNGSVKAVGPAWKKVCTAWRHVDKSLNEFVEADKALLISLRKAGDSLSKQARAEVDREVRVLSKTRRDAIKKFEQITGVHTAAKKRAVTSGVGGSVQ